VTIRLRLASAAALLAFAAPAFAQANAPKPVTRADYLKSLDARFAGIDTNRDGKVTRDELTAQQQRQLQKGKARIAQQHQAKFKQLDTNKDGQLSMQEFLAAAPPIRTTETPDQLLQQLDANKDGTVTADEFRAPQLAKFNRLDANKDGTVTPAELRAAAGQK
jgi:Ca2+-binding EF-hand superfamily protein